MEFSLELIEDKIEIFEASSPKALEKQIEEQINHNKAIMLAVNTVSYQIYTSPEGKPTYSAAVHFKLKKL